MARFPGDYIYSYENGNIGGWETRGLTSRVIEAMIMGMYVSPLMDSGKYYGVLHWWYFPHLKERVLCGMRLSFDWIL